MNAGFGPHYRAPKENRDGDRPPSQPQDQPTDAAVAAFLSLQEDEARRADCVELCRLMSAATGAPAVLWGAAIVGFGRYHCVYESGREGDSMVLGFSPRKGEISIYLDRDADAAQALLARLGRYRAGKSCLYLKRLADVDTGVLAELFSLAAAQRAAQRNDA